MKEKCPMASAMLSFLCYLIALFYSLTFHIGQIIACFTFPYCVSLLMSLNMAYYLINYFPDRVKGLGSNLTVK